MSNNDMLPEFFMLNELELISRQKILIPYEWGRVRNSSDACEIMMKTWDIQRMGLVEEFKILMLDTSSNCIGISRISLGGLSSTTVDRRIVFMTALKAVASQIILVHNHPSGNLAFSHHDINLTHHLKQAGDLLDIRVADHLVLSRNGYISMNDEGLMDFHTSYNNQPIYGKARTKRADGSNNKPPGPK